jgi:hypothetical protein
MAAAPTRWTDERLDDHADRLGRFEANVDRQFDKVDERFDRLEGEVDRRFDKADVATNERFDKADSLEKERFAAVHAELAVASKKADKLIWALASGFVTILAAIVGNALLG